MKVVPDLPVLPYDGTSGWSGTDTSRARAIDHDTSGMTKTLQHLVMMIADAVGERGFTIAELRRMLPEHHHGTLSGSLSVLHKKGLLMRLEETRGRCKVYCLPEHVAGRETRRQGGVRRCPHCGGRL